MASVTKLYHRRIQRKSDLFLTLLSSIFTIIVLVFPHEIIVTFQYVKIRPRDTFLFTFSLRAHSQVKNDKICFLFHLKSSFHSQDI